MNTPKAIQVVKMISTFLFPWNCDSHNALVTASHHVVT